MIGDMKPYPEYKDSGNPWLGEIPLKWDVKRNKLLFTEVNERSKDGSEDLLTVSKYTGITLRNQRQAKQGGLLTNAETLEGYKKVAPGDLVINIMLAWNGSLGVSEYRGIVSPAYSVFAVGHHLVPRYVHYLLRTPTLNGMFKVVSTGVVDSRLRMYPDDFFCLQGIVPSIDEQNSIVRFLNYIDRRIQKYISAKKKLIKLLEEQKQTVINQAVTKGLNPDVKMKPSGIEWLEEIPEHWEITQLRRLVKTGTTITYGIVQAGPDFKEGIPYIRTSDMKGWSLPESGYMRTSPEIDFSYRRSKVVPGDLVVAIRASLGKGLLVPEHLSGANLTQGTARVSPGPSLKSEFLFHSFNSFYCQESIKSKAKGTTFLEITLGTLQRIEIAVPPVFEQAEISRMLNASQARFIRLIERSSEEVNLLREYRTRLISDAVTGKIDVREIAAQLPDEEGDFDVPELDDALDEAIDDLEDSVEEDE